MQTSPTPEIATRIEGFEEFVQSMMKEWKVQGLAMAIVKDGEVIFSKGFGSRDVAKDLEVTPHTLFPIGSGTKAFTTAAMAILADEGKLDWDTPVRHYLPTFKLYDPFMTERMTPRDLVSHRSGLPRHDLVWYNSSASRQELFDRLQYLEPTKHFRAVWQGSAADETGSATAIATTALGLLALGAATTAQEADRMAAEVWQNRLR